MIKVAIIGAGIGMEHLAAYEHLPAFEVAMVVDKDTSKLRSLNDKGIRTSTSIEDALSSDVDIIDVCLPPSLHVGESIRALKAGKHVICEKPIATSLSEKDQLEAASRSADRQVFPVFQYRFGPAFAQLEAIKAAGLAGKPKLATLETHWARDATYYSIPWRGTWAYERGGAIISHAIHAHDLLSHYFSPVEAVTARIATMINPIETEDTGTVMFELAEGAMATSSITLGAATNETRIRFVFEHLTATSATSPYAPAGSRWDFVARDPSLQSQVDDIVIGTPPSPLGFQGFLIEISKAIAGETNSAVTLADGRASIELATAIYASDRFARREQLPIKKQHEFYKGWQP